MALNGESLPCVGLKEISDSVSGTYVSLIEQTAYSGEGIVHGWCPFPFDYDDLSCFRFNEPLLNNLVDVLVTERVPNYKECVAFL